MHYWAIAIIVILAVIFYFRGPDLLPLRRFFLIFTTVYLFGSLLFAAAMLKQFQDHDYYFLDSFFLPSIFILLLLLSLLPSARLNWQRTLYFGILISWVFFSFRMPVRSQRVRHSDGVNDRLQNTIENFTGSAEYLDEINVPRNATMLVIDAVAPNVPLALMERKGLVVVWPVKGMIELALTWDFDYIVFQNEYFSDYVYRGYPEILNRIKRLSTNGRITICQLEENNLQSLDEFLGLTGKPIIDEKIDFELGESGPWRGYLTSCDAAHSGSRAACFTKDYSSGITLEWTNLAFLKQGYHAASMNFWVKTNEVLNAEVVIWMSSDGKTVFNEVRALREYVNGSEGWQNVNYNFVLPEVKGDKSSLSVYLVNRSSSLLYYDDFSFKVYP
jgi:hypothetical protein